MSFTLQSTETGTTKAFDTKVLLGLLPAGDVVNDNIEIGQDVFKISSLVEDAQFVEDANHRFATDAEKAHWNNAPVIAGELRSAPGALAVDLNSRTMYSLYGDKTVDFNGRWLLHYNGTRAVGWEDTRNSLYDISGNIGLIWARTTAAAGLYPESISGYDRVLMDGNTGFLGHGAASVAWKERYLLDSKENLSANWDARKLFVAPLAGVQGTTSNAVALNFNKGVGHRKCTRIELIALVMVAADYGLQIYQTDGVEGLYMWKSTGWTFLG